jgi:2-iminobutanoate/2-iminopropanoate deaminase
MKKIETDQAPQPIGPYVQALVHNGLLFASGQLGIDPATGELADGPASAQALQVLANLAAVLEAAGTSRDQVLKTTIFLKDMNDFGSVNAVYAEFFGDHKPARSTIQVARLPKDALVEIELTAAVQ